MAEYFIKPAGDDSKDGTTLVNAKRTWLAAIALLTVPGDILTCGDGTYLYTTNGQLTCSKVGTVSNPYIIRAQNERMAFISDPGTHYTILTSGASYVRFEGLRCEGGDFNGGSQGDVTHILNSTHLTFSRILIARNNRYINSHLWWIDNSHFNTFEECECYFFQRHAWFFYYSSDNVVRRSYAHSRSYQDLPPPGFPSGYPGEGYGDDFATAYPGSRNIIENCVIENCGSILSMQAVDICTGNKALGCVAFGNDNTPVNLGPVLARGSGAFRVPRDTLFENCVCINSFGNGTNVVTYARGAFNTQINNCTIYTVNGGSPPAYGVATDIEPSYPGDGTSTISGKNNLYVSVNGPPVSITPGDIDTWSFTKCNFFNCGATVPASSPNFINCTTTNPNFGTVRCWVPATSPMHGAGLGGVDIGANVLYRYQNGILTTAPLWNTLTAEFPHGAVIAGMNDTASTSCYNVHTRIGVSVANFPIGYGGGDTTPPATPTGVYVI